MLVGVGCFALLCVGYLSQQREKVEVAADMGIPERGRPFRGSDWTRERRDSEAQQEREPGREAVGSMSACTRDSRAESGPSR